MDKETREKLEGFINIIYCNHPLATRSFPNKEEAMQDLYKQLTTKPGYNYFQTHRNRAASIRELYESKKELKKYISSIFQLKTDDLNKIRKAIVEIIDKEIRFHINTKRELERLKKMHELREQLKEDLGDL